MRLPPMAEHTPLLLGIDCSCATIEPLLTTALLRVFVNGHAIGFVAVQGRTWVRFPIPLAFLRPNEPIELRFEHPAYFRMAMTDLGAEDRMLAVCFYSVCLYPPWMSYAAEQLVRHPDGCRQIDAEPPMASVDDDAERTIYRFGADAPDRDCLGQGWRFDDAGNAWADARESYVTVPAPGGPGRYRARFAMAPLFIRSVLESQRITILLAGTVIGQFKTGTEGNISVALPPELITPGGMLRFAFILPDGVPMHEFDPTMDRYFLSFILDKVEIVPIPQKHADLAPLRVDDLMPPSPIAVSNRFLDESVEALPDAVKAELGLDISEIMAVFESLGDNCAFGLAQRKAGCEVLGLLRFANTPLKNLITALDDEFRAVTDKTEIEMRWVPSAPGEFIVFSDRYGLRWHTSVFDVDADRTTLFAQQSLRLSYLRRKFYEGLRAGRKIFTISRAEPRKHPIPMPDADELEYWEERPEPLRLADIVPLFLKLNEYGTNTVLYLTRCERDRRSGTVELIAPGVMRGYVDEFVILQDLAIRDHAAWMRVAVNAWLLHNGAGASFRQRSE